MDLEVVGRHALLFDDDATAAFSNSSDALVEWNGLSIDRYDVRHLLPSPPPPRKPRRHYTDDPSLESELDRERYLDLPPPGDDEQELDFQEGAKPVDTGGYRAVSFSYGKSNESIEENNNDADFGFRPPFQVPESLLQSLPPTEKLHQIIARTAIFVSKHGGQSEIVLRVKQGDNPTFGFLMPDHHLHSYFRFLVDHHELLEPDNGSKFLEEKNIADTGLDHSGGALSILGSVYGSGEDEDGTTEDVPESEEAVDAGNANVSHGLEQAEPCVNAVGKDEVVAKSSFSIMKEKAPIIKRNRFITTVGNSSGNKNEGDGLTALSTTEEKSQTSLPRTSKVEGPIVEPPSDLKRVVDKIVEFILRNGKEFEAVLVEQDKKHGRFPFLLPSNQFHPYYLEALEKDKESKLPGKVSVSEKHDPVGHGLDKKTASSKEGDTLSGGSASHDIPYNFDKKEKFKMVIGKSKKDGQDLASKATEPQIDAAAAAAILQAATRGIKNAGLEFFPRTSLNGSSRGPSIEGGHASSIGSLQSSQPQNSILNPGQTGGDSSVSVPVAKAIAETAAIAAASEADSSEACLTKEQKLKAERLKRAKMFAAMIKTAPMKTEPLRGLSAEPSVSGISGSGADFENLVGKEREGSSVPMDIDTSDKIEMSGKKNSDEYNERRSKRSYRSRSKRHEQLEEEEKEEREEEYKRSHKHSRKKHRSHRSSHHIRDRHKHRKRHSSSEDTASRHLHNYDDSLDDEHQHSSHQHKHDAPSEDERRHSKHHRKHASSSDNEHLHSRRRRKHLSSSSEDEHEHRSRSVKYRKSQPEEVDLEEGEILTKSDQSQATQGNGASREASVEVSKSYRDGRAPSRPSETTEVSDDLRAKIRAMLMATM